MAYATENPDFFFFVKETVTARKVWWLYLGIGAVVGLLAKTPGLGVIAFSILGVAVGLFQVISARLGSKFLFRSAFAILVLSVAVVAYYRLFSIDLSLFAAIACGCLATGLRLAVLASLQRFALRGFKADELETDEH